jgi:hypothetical protein
MMTEITPEIPLANEDQLMALMDTQPLEEVDPEDVRQNSQTNEPTEEGMDLSTDLNPDDNEAQGPDPLILSVFPAARIKKIVKEDPNVSIVSNDAIFLISKAAVRRLVFALGDPSDH